MIPVEIKVKTIEARGIKFSIIEAEQETARAYLYIMYNDLHSEPFALLEDVYVDESQRGKGLATKLVKQVITAAQQQGCYKLIANSRKSRPKVHQLYKRLGFQEQGLEFRIDFPVLDS
ncbi:MAG: GNAT family N-acetyltransferase [Pleurocapsa sp.]